MHRSLLIYNFLEIKKTLCFVEVKFEGKNQPPFVPNENFTCKIKFV